VYINIEIHKISGTNETSRPKPRCCYDEALVQLLLETGRAEPDSKDSDNRTPLSSAAREGNEAVVQLLLTTGRVEPGSQDSARLLPDIALPRR